MATRKPGDDVIHLQAEMDVKLKQSSADAVSKAVSQFVTKLEKDPIELGLDVKQIKRFKDIVDGLDRQLKALGEPKGNEGKAKLKIIQDQIKAQERLLELTLRAERARQQYGSKEQALVAKGGDLTDAKILAMARNKSGRQELESIAKASLARDEVVGAARKLSKALIEAQLHADALELNRIADQAASVGGGLSKRLTAGGIGKAKESRKAERDQAKAQLKKEYEDELVAEANAIMKNSKARIAAEDAAVKTERLDFERRTREEANAIMKNNAAVLKAQDAATAASLKKSKDNLAEIKSIREARVKAIEQETVAEANAIMKNNAAVLKAQDAAKNKAEQEAIAARKVSAGRDTFSAAGGIDNFDPSRLKSRADIGNTRDFLISERNRLNQIGDVEGMRKYQTALDSLTNSHKKLNGVMSQGGALVRQFFRYAIGYQAMYQALGAVTALGRGIVDLDKNLYDIQAISQSTTGEMVVLAGAINDVAVNSKFSVNEISEATKVLAQAGVATKDLPATLKAVADLGAATGSDLGVAADVLTSMQEIFKDLTAGEAANQLTKAVNLSKLTVQDLQTIVSTGAQIAESYNVTSEQLLSAASVLRNAGVKASTIATGTRQALLEVFNPDKNSLDKLQTAYRKRGENLTAADITSKYQGFTKTEDPLLAAVTELKRIGFGTDMSLNRTFDVRAENVLHELIKSYDQLVKMQGQFNFGQPAAEGAEIAMGSLSAKVDNLGGAMVALGAQITGGPVSALKDLVDWATQGVEKLQKMDIEMKAKDGLGLFGGTSGGMLTGSAIGGGIGTAGGFLLGGPGGALVGGELGTGIGGLAGASLGKWQEMNTTDQEILKVRLENQQKLVSQAEKDLQEMKDTRAAYDPESVGPHTLGEQIRLINEGLSGTQDQIALAKTRLGSVAENITSELRRLQDKMAQYANDPAKYQEYAKVFENLQSSFPDLYDILNQTGKYSDPKEAMKAIEQVAIVWRDSVSNLDDIAQKEADKRLKAIDAATTEAQLILASSDPTALSAMVTSYLTSLNTMGLQAAQDRLDAIRKALESELASTNPADTAKITSLQTQLGNVGKAQENWSARNQQAASGYASGLQQSARDNSGKLDEFLNSPEGKRLTQSDPAAVSILRGVAGGVDLSSYGAGGVGNGLSYSDAAGTGLAPTSGDSRYSGLDKFKTWADRQNRYVNDIPPPDNTPKEFIPDVSKTSRISELDLQIEKVKEFGGEAGQLLALTKERNAIDLEEQRRAVEFARDKFNTSGKDADQKKYAEENIKLQKMELDAKKDYIDAITKDADNELKVYQERAKTVIAQGGDITTLNDEFKSRQQAAIELLRQQGESLGLSKAQIDAEIQSRGLLNQSLITDKVFNDQQKTLDKTLEASLKAVPTDPTTGNRLLDAQSRVRGWGFTEQELAGLYTSQIGAKQNVIADARSNIASTKSILPGLSESQTEQATAKIAAWEKQIKDLTNEVDDLTVSLQDMGTTATDQLSQAFGKESIRPYLIALEQSQNSLKNWGANLRGHVLSAWEGIGDAIADSVVNGEKFNDLMKNLVKNFAGDVLRTSAKGALNTLGRMVLGNALPGTEQQAGKQGAGTSPAAGGFLGTVASVLGFGGSTSPAASATGTMTVQAGVVNVVGGGKAMESAAKEMMAGKDGKGIFSSLWDGIGNLASDAWGGITSGASSAGSAISTGVSAASSWISSLFAADGWVGHFSNGYVDRNGIIRGPGTGTSDSIPGLMKFAKGYKPIMISNRESILTEKATKFLGHDTIGQMNSGHIPGFNAGRVADRAAMLSSSVDRKAMAPVVHVPEFPTPTLEASVYLDPSQVVTKGLRNNPGAVRELANIERIHKRTLSATRK